ncbi:hypothetical protein CgunFtcFv8_017222 [Champsocephalus gunnari]|uniref:HAT C-terminal dimerisation domain-containing protein n=1 Tax=Champsocephalus gunnari TaxID=52237 RepID=A0AAN8DKG9_CHAGU|nr:hypothetical protein CgunFtcFv8_017222 [Champsocephalus gunnari]
MLEILAQIVELPVLQEIRSSQAISLEVDETTEVYVRRQLDLHVRHLDKEGCVFNHFLDLVTLEDGKADRVVAAIKSALQKKELPVDRLYGLGTDSAAVMTDMEFIVKSNGLLALACKDASNAVRYMAHFRNHLRSAATTLGLNDLKVKEVKDTRWLSQDLAVQNLQRNLPAVLAALAEEGSTRKWPVAKGRCAAPHSNAVQGVSESFLHIKEQVPVTLWGEFWRQTRPHSPERSLLADTKTWTTQVDLGPLAWLERIRRGHGILERPREEMWARFVRDTLTDKFIPGQDATVIQEWNSYKQHVLVGAFKDKTQAEIMQLLASEKDEWSEIYPNLCLLSSVGLVIPVSSVNCERDFSTMNRVKTDLRNRLKGEHLAADSS